jgi:ferrous iron transport protein B
MTFGHHPANSLAWILGLLAVFACVIGGLWRYGRQSGPPLDKGAAVDPV